MGVAVAGLIIGAVGTAVSIQQQQKAAKSQKKAQKAQQRQAELRARRQRVQAVREERIKRASIIAQSGMSGTVGSSGALGGVGSLASQGAAQQGFMGQQIALGGQANEALADASAAQQRAGVAGAIGGIGQGIFEQQGGFQTIFGGGSNSPESNSIFG